MQAMVKGFGRKTVGKRNCRFIFLPGVQAFGLAAQNLVIDERFSGIALQKALVLSLLRLLAAIHQ